VLTQTGSLTGPLAPANLSAPPGHRHSSLVIRLTLLWHLDAHVSLRGVVLVLASLLGLLASGLRLALPCPQTVRLWLLRVGLYLLRRVLRRRSDWVFILDHTIRLGQRKCLLILGTSLQRLREPTASLGHHDVVVLDLWVTTHCTGADVAERLRTVSARVGVPRQLVCDHGADLVKGIGLFQAEQAEVADQPKVVDTYDVTHRLACLVKAELEPDPRWQALLRLCTSSLFGLQQTAGAFLVPPAPRRLSRYLNVDRHVAWAVRMLTLLEAPDGTEVAGLLKMGLEEARSWLESKLGWLRDFREDVSRWARLLRVVQQTHEEVKHHGLSRQTARRVWRGLDADILGQPQVRSFVARVLWYLRAEGGQIPPGESWLGTSDVIESLFGKYKWLGEKAPYAEVGASVLALPVFTTELTEELVNEALSAVSGNEVRAWIAEHVGRSTLSKVRTATAAANAAENTAEQDTKAA
jgi:hypothetical protein